ncbi:transmembrane protein 216 isoform X3 [Dromaius novaehollandiae]
MLFLYLGVEATRIFFGSKGNLCQRKVPLSISLALTFPAATMAAYYLLLQTYALRLEAILNAILLVFYTAELLLGVLTLASFSRFILRHSNMWDSMGDSREPVATLAALLPGLHPVPGWRRQEGRSCATGLAPLWCARGTEPSPRRRWQAPVAWPGPVGGREAEQPPP